MTHAVRRRGVPVAIATQSRRGRVLRRKLRLGQTRPVEVVSALQLREPEHRAAKLRARRANAQREPTALTSDHAGRASSNRTCRTTSILVS
jgi:hypothetical protein